MDIFFVISGFLITRIIMESYDNDRFSYAEFYARRIKRIFPALAAVSAACLFFGWYILLPDEFQLLGKHTAAGACFVSNIVSWSEAGYFDAAADTKPLLHLWSLGVEEQFYFLWPLCLVAILKRRGDFLTITGLVAIASLAICIATVFNSPIASFYLPFSRFWELMIGAILARISRQSGLINGHYANMTSLVGIVMIAASTVWLTKESAFPGYWALIPTIGTFLVICAGPKAWLNKYALSNRLIVAVGLISYPLYLWHWPLLVFAKIALGRLLTPTERVEAITVATILAVASYRLVELPLRRSAVRIFPGVLAMLMAGIACFGLLSLLGFANPRLQTENVSKILRASHDWEYPPVASRNPAFGGPLRYFVQDSGLGTYTLFFGDSNIEQYAPRIDHAIKERPNNRNGAIFVGNQNECSVLSAIFIDDKRCPETLKKLSQLIAQPSTRTVVIAGAWLHFKEQLTQSEAQTRFVRFLQEIAASKRIFLIMNIPTGPELAPKSMFTGSRFTQIFPKPVSAIRFDFERFTSDFLEINRILSDAARKGGATLIDPVDALCPHQKCPVFDEAGNPLYLDASHLTRSYAINSATYIDKTLEP